MQSFVPLELLLLTLPIIAPTGVHQLPLQLRHNYTAYRRQLGRFRDVYGKFYFIVDFDISRSDSLIVDRAAGGESEYDYRNSDTFQNLSIPVHYGVDTSGYLATDTFKIPMSVLNSVKQPFVWINYHNHGFIDFFYSSLGLGMPENSNSFLHRIKHQLQKPLFSLYFEPIDVWSGIQSLSLTFGGIDNHCRRRPIFYTNYVNTSLLNYQRPWTFRMKAITIPSDLNGTEELVIRVNAAVGIITYPFIIGPWKYIKRIAHRLGARTSQEEDFEYAIDCAKLRSRPPVFIHIGGKALKLTAEDYIIKIENDPHNYTSSSYSCYLAFQAHSFFGITFGDSWYVGTALFNSRCLVLDFGKKRIGFAAPKKAREP